MKYKFDYRIEKEDSGLYRFIITQQSDNIQRLHKNDMIFMASNEWIITIVSVPEINEHERTIFLFNNNNRRYSRDALEYFHERSYEEVVDALEEFKHWLSPLKKLEISNEYFEL